MKVFILEDDEQRITLFLEALCVQNSHDVTIRKDVPSAIKAWEPPYDVVCLDHDLGGEVYVPSEHENTGFQFVRFLTEPPSDKCASTVFVVHSYNPEGAEAMLRQLQKHYRWSVREPFGLQLLTWLQTQAPA